jgi:Carboxypeptidase regulatory-like domain
VQRTFRLAAAAASVGGLLAAALLTGSGSAAAASQAAGAQSRSAHATSSASSVTRLPLSARQMLADRQQHIRAAEATGSVTGMALSATGQPLAHVCVVAYGASGTRFAATQQDGRYFISGLRPGTYHLRYLGCGGSSQYLPEWYGGTAQQAGSSPVVISQSTVKPLAPVTLQSLNLPAASIGDISLASPAATARSVMAGLGLPGATMGQSPAGQTTAGQLAAIRHARKGWISGVVTATSGKPIKGICVEAVSVDNFYYGVGITAKNGHYRTSALPAGQYDVVFFPACGSTGNWLVQVYKDRYTLTHPTAVRVRIEKTAGGVNAALKLGGEISGVVTNAAGHKLSAICVDPSMPGNRHRLYLGGMSENGIYHLRGMPAGPYQLFFSPCGPSRYASMWWHNAQRVRNASLFRLKKGQLASGVNEVMPLGAVMAGTVTAAANNEPLKGICVVAYDFDGNFFFGGITSTNAAGQYTIQGLSTGSYAVQFFPGCNNNGNYLSVSYHGLLNLTDAHTAAGIDAALPPGATLSGTITSAATGNPLAGICVSISGGDSQYGYYNETQSASNGTYSFNQMSTGTYQVQFAGGCGNGGSYAPQSYGSASPYFPGNIKVTKTGQSVTGISAAMLPGATITGTVTSSTGQKLSGICVLPVVAEDALAQGVSKDGSYRIANLQPAEYQMIFAPGCGNNQDLAGISFGGQESFAAAPYVSAVAGTTSGIDATLPAGGAISGRVRNRYGKPVDFSCIYLTGLSGAAAADSGEDISFGASYELSGVLPGAYHVTFSPSCIGSGYATQWYRDKASPAGAAKVVIRAGRTTSGISSALVRGGSIAGTISFAGKPVRDMCVFAQSTSQSLDYGYGLSDRAGKYVVRGLNSGRYELELQPCGGNSGDLAIQVLSRLVTIHAPRRATGVNATAETAGAIGGKVLGGSPAVAQPGICVEAFQVNGYAGGYYLTGLNGNFKIGNLPAGKYLVYFNDPGCAPLPTNLAPVWYPEAAAQAGATEVTVSKGSVTNLTSSTLPTDGAIAGSVTGPGPSPLAGVCVSARPLTAGSPAVYAVTAGDGSYSIIGLAPASYRVEFSSGCGASGYQTQWWKNKNSARSASLVTVTAGTTTANISAALKK